MSVGPPYPIVSKHGEIKNIRREGPESNKEKVRLKENDRLAGFKVERPVSRTTRGRDGKSHTSPQNKKTKVTP